MLPDPRAAVLPFRCETAGAGGGTVSLALSSGQATPRSGIGSRGAFGASPAGARGGGANLGGKGGGGKPRGGAAHPTPAPFTPQTPPPTHNETLTSPT